MGHYFGRKPSMEDDKTIQCPDGDTLSAYEHYSEEL
jgi:hypothetical protein